MSNQIRRMKCFCDADGLSGIAADGGFLFYDCFLQQWGQSLLLRKCIFFLAVPVGMFVLLLAFWLVRALLKPQEWTCLLSHLITSATVFTHLFYSGVVQRVISLVHGIRLGVPTSANGLSTFYWVDGFTTEYFSGDHLVAALILGIPSAIILVGLPLSIVRILRSREHQTYDAGLAARYPMVTYPRSRELLKARFESCGTNHCICACLLRYGFLYLAYRERYVHWELAVIIRKVLIVSVVMFGGPWHPRLQGIACLVIILVALVAHLAVQPFREEVSGLNRLEAISLLGTTITYTVILI